MIVCSGVNVLCFLFIFISILIGQKNYIYIILLFHIIDLLYNIIVRIVPTLMSIMFILIIIKTLYIIFTISLSTSSSKTFFSITSSFQCFHIVGASESLLMILKISTTLSTTSLTMSSSSSLTSALSSSSLICYII